MPITYTAFTPPASTPDTVAPVAFTPPASTPDTVAPVAFTPPSSTTSSTAPTTFFPVSSQLFSVSELQAQPTINRTPGAGMVTEVVLSTTTQVYVLTAGTHAADATHILPLDYDATTNAKFWLQVASGTHA